MQKSSESTSAVQKLVRRRKWTPKAKARVVRYAINHSIVAAIKKYSVAGSMVNRWKQEYNDAHVDKRYPANESKGQQEKLILPTHSSTARILAKKLEREIVERVVDKQAVGKLELTALLLAKEILK